jgi:hypothetical protein
MSRGIVEDKLREKINFYKLKMFWKESCVCTDIVGMIE